MQEAFVDNLDDSERESLRKELASLDNEHSCTMEENPTWCVWGRAFVPSDLPETVQYYIRPEHGDEFVARRMAIIIDKLQGKANAKKVEEL